LKQGRRVLALQELVLAKPEDWLRELELARRELEEAAMQELEEEAMQGAQGVQLGQTW